MKELTQCQQNVLRYISDYTSENVIPPTIREVADHFEITVKAAQDHITALRKKQYLAPSDRRSRSLRVLVDIEPKENKVPGLIAVPIITGYVPGKPFVCAENTDGQIFVPSSFLQNLQNGENFAIVVQGQSMVGIGINDGDTAIISPCTVEMLKDGDIVAVIIDEIITLKRYFKESSRIRLESENSDFKPIYCLDLRLAGKLSTIIRIF